MHIYVTRLGLSRLSFSKQTSAVGDCVVPIRSVQTQQGLRRLTVSVFEADVTLHSNHCVVDRLSCTQSTVQRLRQLRTIYD